jgi:hypothetical protein
MSLENWRLIIKGCVIHIFFGFSEVMSERVTVPNTCLILDLITSEPVHTTRGMYCINHPGQSI